MTLRVERLEALIVARAHGQAAKLTLSDLLRPLGRFAPAELTAGAWRDRLAEVVAALRAQGVLDADHRLADAGELARRIGRCTARGWPELSDRVLPGLALGIAADDAKLRARLDGRDAWAAAIVGRTLGLWRDGSPPSLPALCDALVWRDHGLTTPPKRCPPELRAVYIDRRLGSTAGVPERGVRLLAAREVGAPRPELRVLRDALVRGWLAGRALEPAPSAPPPDDAPAGATEGAHGGRSAEPARSAPPPDDAPAGATEGAHGGRSAEPARSAPPPDDAPAGAVEAEAPASFAAAVLAAAGATTDGWFGDRKVFVSAVWDQLRKDSRWSALALGEFKARLVAAHRAGALTLARADLVAAMDPALVAASEIAADGASFHFVVKEPAT